VFIAVVSYRIVLKKQSIRKMCEVTDGLTRHPYYIAYQQ